MVIFFPQIDYKGSETEFNKVELLIKKQVNELTTYVVNGLRLKNL